MSEIKYTNDGKKVVVIGNLNSQEKIVQEIFIVNGNEVPSGENFVVKTLHDAPAVSWKETEMKKIEDNYNRARADFERETNRLKDSFHKQKALLEGKLSFLYGANKNIDPAVIQTLFDVLCLNIKYVVEEGYRSVAVKPFDDILFESYREKNLKLISVLGSSKGDLSYRIHYYSDGSGGSTKIYPFVDLDSANAFAKQYMERVIKEGKISNDSIKCAEEFGVEIPKEVLISFYSKRADDIQKSINSEDAAQQRRQDELNKLTKTIIELKGAQK